MVHRRLKDLGLEVYSISIGYGCPHPKSLSLGERDFESCSLLLAGEGLGMRGDP
jgi:hypothetical protein